MKTFWTSHCKTKEERASFKEYVLNSSPVIDRIVAYVESKQKKVTIYTPEELTKGDWEVLAADRNGYMRAQREILEFLDLTQKGDTHDQ